MTRRSALLLSLLVVLSEAGAAHAGDAALAETLFRRGRSLMEANDYAAACPILAESFQQDPATGTLLALALCQEGLGATASAWASFSLVITRAKRDANAEREQAAREHMQALEPKLSHLTIVVAADAATAPGVVVKRDGIPLGQPAWGAPAPVDPGDHVVEAVAPGKRVWRTMVHIGAAADAQTITVPPLENESSAASTSATNESVQGGAVPGGSDSSQASSGPPLRTIGLVTGGVGLVALGLGAYFGIRASSLNSESKADNHCDANNDCDALGLAKRDDAVSASTAATISFIAGGVLTATGVTLFLVGGSSASERSARVEAIPALAPGLATMVVRGRF